MAFLQSGLGQNRTSGIKLSADVKEKSLNSIFLVWCGVVWYGVVWCVVCGVWCVVCGVWCVVCDVMWYLIFIIQLAINTMFNFLRGYQFLASWAWTCDNEKGKKTQKSCHQYGKAGGDV